MRTDVKRLKESANQKGLNFETIATRIGVNKSTFYRKINSKGEKFTIGEIHRMVEVIPLTKEEAVSIFLAENSQ